MSQIIKSKFYIEKDTDIDNKVNILCQFIKGIFIDNPVNISYILEDIEKYIIVEFEFIINNENYIYEFISILTEDIFEIIPKEFNNVYYYDGIELVDSDPYLCYLVHRSENYRKLLNIINMTMANHKMVLESLLTKIKDQQNEINYLKIYTTETMMTPTIWQIIGELCEKTNNSSILEQYETQMFRVH